VPTFFLDALPSVPVFAALCFVAFLAGVMRGFSGFGGGLLIAPAYSLFLSPTDVVVLVVVLNLLTTIQLMPDIVPSVKWPIIWRLFVPSLVGVPIGVAMLHTVDPMFMRKAIGLIVVSVALLMLRGWNYKGRRGKVQDILVGTSCGYLTSIGGIGGPPIILYLLSDKRLSAGDFRAICLMLFFMIQLLALAQIGFSGSITSTHGVYIAILLPVYIFAHWVGAVSYRYSINGDQAQFKRISLWLLLLVGLTAVVL